MCVEKEMSNKEEEKERIDHPPSSSSYESNLSHTLNMFIDDASLKNSIASMNTNELLHIINACAYIICSLYQMFCLCCGSHDHIYF